MILEFIYFINFLHLVHIQAKRGKLQTYWIALQVPEGKKKKKKGHEIQYGFGTSPIWVRKRKVFEP